VSSNANLNAMIIHEWGSEMFKRSSFLRLARNTVLGLTALAAVVAVVGFFIWILPNSCRAEIVHWGICGWYTPPTPTPEPPEGLDGRETIFQYFSYLNKDDPQCASAWAMLSPRFQLEENQNDERRYCGFWNTVKEVVPVEVVEVETGGNSAVFLITLYWVPGDGVPYDSTYRYSLIGDPDSGEWLIDATEPE